jgi:hypothetical protein
LVDLFDEVLSGSEQLNQQSSGGRSIVVRGVGLADEFDPVISANKTQIATSCEMHRAEPRGIWKTDAEPLKLGEQEAMVKFHIVTGDGDTPGKGLKEFTRDFAKSWGPMNVTSTESVDVSRTQIPLRIDQGDEFPNDCPVEVSHDRGHLHDAMMPLREETSGFDINDCDARHTASLLDIQYIQASG